MDRRELLKMIALATGGAVVGSEFFLTGCNAGGKAEVGFTPGNVALLNEVGETILPATSSPGAKEAQVGEFMKTYVTDCYSADDQKIFQEGITKLNEACNKMHGHDFMKASADQRKELLISLDKDAKQVQEENSKAYYDFRNRINGDNTRILEFKSPHATHYFTMMKQLTLLGFFTSQVGATKALRYEPVPRKYDGALPYKKGDKAWAD